MKVPPVVNGSSDPEVQRAVTGFNRVIAMLAAGVTRLEDRATAAEALLATHTADIAARIRFLRKSFTFADNGQTLTVGTIPPGSQLLKPISGVSVNEAFNGNATNTLDIGPSTDPGTNLWGTLLALGSIGYVPLDEAVSMTVAVETIVQAKVVSTASASTGQGEIVIAYIPG